MTNKVTPDEFLSLLKNFIHEQNVKRGYTSEDEADGYSVDEDDVEWSELSYILRDTEQSNGNIIKFVADFGGEGQGDTAWVVLSYTVPSGHVQYFRKDGYYASYDGFYWDGELVEVRPREKTITVYDKA